jgi:hypothetical protein
MILEVEKVGSLLTYVSHIDSNHEGYFIVLRSYI